MPNILHVSVPITNAAIVWPANADPSVETLLFINTDLNNTIWIGQQSIITAGGQGTIPIPPNGTFSANENSPWYVIGSVAGTQPLVVVPNGAAYFLGLTQGMGNLAIPSVQSPNFASGLSGWQIAKDGSAEFNNLTIRGTYFGTNFILNSTGAFFYSPTEALGNLSVSITPNGGTGPFGETVDPGIVDYSLAPGLPFNAQLNNGQLNIKDNATSAGGRLLQVRRDGLFSGSSGPGAPFGITLADSGLSGDSTYAAQILLQAASTSGAAAADIELLADQVRIDRSSGLNVNVSGALAAAPGASAINPNNVFTNLSPVYSIPGNDAKNGTTYRLTATGKLTFGATLQVLTFQLVIGAGVQLPIGTAEFVVNNTYSWKIVGEFSVVNGPLNAATLVGSLEFTLGSDSANEATVAASTQTAGGFIRTNTSTLDMTGGHSFALQVKFAAASAGNSITCSSSYPERIGP